MSHLVISDQSLATTIGERLTFHASDDSVDGIVDLREADRLLTTAGGEDRCFVEKIGQVGSGEPGGASGNAVEGELGIEFFIPGMHLQNGQTAFDVRGVDCDLAIETTGTHQCRVENVGTIGCGNDDDSAIAFEAVHFCEQLVQGLLAFIVSTTDSSASLAANSINLIDKDQARAVLFGTLEEVANAAGTNANKHLHELRTGEREKGNTGFTSNRFCKQGLARARRANQKHTFGNLCTH